MSTTTAETRTHIEFKDKEDARAWFKANNNSDQIMFFGSRVLDVTNFKHPGPQKLISDALDTDIQEDYTEQAHSGYADELLNQLTIGYLPEKVGHTRLTNEHFMNGLSKEEEEIHTWLDRNIDLKKPLLPQVSKMTNKQFLAFVKRPRQLPGDSYDGIQLWEDKFKDEESKSNYTHNLIVMMPIITALVTYAVNQSTTWNEAFFNFSVFFVILGVTCFWTITEYYLHRFSRHGEHFLDPNGEDDGDQLVELFAGHLSHHVFMNQEKRIAIDLKTYLQYFTVSWVILQFVLPAPILYMLFPGWFFGSLLYDGLHLSFHFNWPIPGAYYQSIKDAHMRHHFRDTGKEFGVTTPIWDYVCGTARDTIKQA